MSSNYAGRSKPILALESGRLVTKNVPVPAQTLDQLRRSYATRVINDLRVMQWLRTIPRFDGRTRTELVVLDRWSLFEKLFDELAAANTERGSQLVLVYLPNIHDVGPSYRDTIRRNSARRYTSR